MHQIRNLRTFPRAKQEWGIQTSNWLKIRPGNTGNKNLALKWSDNIHPIWENQKSTTAKQADA